MQAEHHFAVRYPDLTRFPEELHSKIAVHGLHLKSQKQVQVGQRVGLQFRFPQREDPLLAVGVIAWVAAQPDDAGKRGLIVKNIEFDSQAQEVLQLVAQTPEVQETEAVEIPPAAPPPAPSPSPPVAIVSTPPVPEEKNVALDWSLDDEFTGTAPQEPQKKRWLIPLLASLALVIAALVWLFAFNGLQFIAIRFMPPPPALNIAYAEPQTPGIEPPIPGKPAPPPVKTAPPPVVAVGFDFYQRSAVNEFIVTFNRPVPRVVTSRLESPLVQTFSIERARLNLDKDQFFLPFDLIRTVSFEMDGSTLLIRFIAQNPHYLPQPAYHVRGRELVIKFVASD